MSCKVVVAIYLTVLVTVCTGADWCNIESCKSKGNHTLCAYPNQNPGKKCNPPRFMYGEMTDNDKKNVESIHNSFRTRVKTGSERRGSPGPQPRSTSIPFLKWDKELEQIAQRWVNQCTPGNDQCRDLPGSQVGQNFADKSIKHPRDASIYFHLPDIVEDWYNEVQYFNKDEVKNLSGNLTGANGKYIGSYTQMMWAKTTHVGCASRNFREGDMNHRYFVCNYKPAGNIAGMPIYPTK